MVGVAEEILTSTQVIAILEKQGLTPGTEDFRKALAAQFTEVDTNQYVEQMS